MSTSLSSARSAAEEGLRAVAKTWKPRDWKFLAIAQPMPEVLQPVIRTAFFWIVAMVSVVVVPFILKGGGGGQGATDQIDESLTTFSRRNVGLILYYVLAGRIHVDIARMW